MNKTQKAQTLQQEYSLRFDGLEEYRKTMWKILCNDFFQRYVPLDSKILDVGAGYGEFITNINAKEKYAMDLNPHMREFYATNKIHFLEQDCTKTWGLEDNSLDVVFSSNFLEHLHTKDSIEFVLQQAHRVLKTQDSTLKDMCLSNGATDTGGGGKTSFLAQISALCMMNIGIFGII